MQVDDTVPEDLVKYLCKKIPAFKNEAVKHQWALAKMVWDGGLKSRKHYVYTDAMSFHYKELESHFGRSVFNAINERLDFFKQSNNWSMQNNTTRAYWFSEKVKTVRDSYLRIVWRKETRLIRADGKAMQSIPKAVASQDKRGQTTKAWVQAKALNHVKVDMDNLKRLRNWLKNLHDAYLNGRTPDDLFIKYNEDTIKRMLDLTCQMIRLGRTKPVGTGYIVQRYEEAQSGRVYAQRLNLQTVPSLIKEASLSGLWEYDFANCHFSIFNQMADKAGYQCTAIQHYLANKEQVRQLVANQAGISKNDAKACLLALIYGANITLWEENAIPQAIGMEASAKLFKVPEFLAIKHDINKAQHLILKTWVKTANGLVNAFGKAIKATARPVEQMAHLTQGIEAKALQTALNLYPESIVLLQHDGFASIHRLDTKAITDAIFEVTGYNLELEEKVIQPNPDAYFLKVANRADSKVEKPKTLATMSLTEEFS